jgi:soluble lytic murein transglycosylase-like protein
MRAIALLLAFAALLFPLQGCSTSEAAVNAVVAAGVEFKAVADEVDNSPPAARKYRSTLIRNARVVWGMDAPIATFAAQVHQESAWNPEARSPVGALGLAQFMPGTARDMANRYPDALGGHDPGNADWALRALVQYDYQIFRPVSAANECERMAMTMFGYNAGPSWIPRDQAAATRAGLDSQRYFGHVERVNGGRTQAAWNENRQYVTRIIRKLQPQYAAWGRQVCEGLT